MTDRRLLLKKLARLREHVNLLRQRRPAALDEFRSRDRQDLAALAFVVAMQEAIDIAAHVCADDGLGLPGSYGESFLLLTAPGILGEELARQLARMVHVRNRIVHGYLSVDFETFWRDLPAGITGLDGFAAAIARRAGPPSAEKSAGS